MRVENEAKLDYKNVLIRPKRSTLGSRKEVKLERTFKFRNYKPRDEKVEYHYKGVPVMGANMDGVGTFEVAKEFIKHSMFTCLVKTYSKEQLIEFFQTTTEATENVAVSIGVNSADLEKFEEVYNAIPELVKFVCIDVANGYSERFVEFVRNFRQKYPHVVIIAGNVVTADQTQELIMSGADIIKVGIGPGSVCTTRIKTGVGYPQLSAVMECADAAHGLSGHVIADGGCTCAGDVSKAFAGGTDFVMLGGMFAGHNEGGGEVIRKFKKTGYCDENGKDILKEEAFVTFYGMSSEAANKKHFGGLKEYRSSEGREVLVPYRGAIDVTVKDILGGVRSTCTYVGAKSLKQLSKCTTFITVTQQYNATYESTTYKI